MKMTKYARKSTALLAAVALVVMFWTSVAFAAPLAPIISTPSGATTTSPILLTGTAEASTTVMVTGGISTSTASTTVSGDWSVSVGLNAGINHLSVTALDLSGSTSPAAVVDIAYDNTAPAAPVVSSSTFQFASTSPVTINGTAEASSTISITGGAGSASATTTGGGDWSASVSLTPNTVNHLSLTATDSLGNTSSSTLFNLTYDTLVPVFGTMTDITSTSGADGEMVLNYSLPTATDNLTATSSIAVSCTPSSGTTFSAGTTTVSCTAADQAGNTATTSFSVIVTRVAGGSSSGGGDTSGGHRQIPPGLLVAVQVANPNSNVANVLAGFVNDTLHPRVLGAEFAKFLRTLKNGDRGDDVTAIQDLLKRLGVYSGPVTGYYGNLTRNAIRKFQKDLGLRVTGTLDAETMDVLNNS